MSLKTFLMIISLLALYFLGLCIFLTGYLLKRIEVHENSTRILNLWSEANCSDPASLRTGVQQLEAFISGTDKLEHSRFENQSPLKRFDKMVIIVIDALRYDFVVYHNDSASDKSPFLNKMPIFSSTVFNHPDKAILIQLIADAPTTTLQRLKGITTGSLPTFIDASLNFGCTEIEEDNLIRQLNNANRKIIFMGDDTWMSMFPGQFHRAYPFPSFNVKDLDTVDNGILKHIYQEIAKDDWDVIIAHFLGVDHCGHRHGPSHPAMTTKLKQMNSVIEKVMAAISEDTLLAVLGDHGMTPNGDHGGDSDAEVATALFLFNPHRITYGSHFSKDMIVSQKDIVPTLSLLIGIPIPFSNLGSVFIEPFHIHSCFSKDIDSRIGGALALAENSIQVHQYLRRYSQISQELDSVMFEAEVKLRNASILWRNLTENSSDAALIISALLTEYKSYLVLVETECQMRWATFDLDAMFLGSVILSLAVLYNFIIAYNHTITSNSFKLLIVIFLTLVEGVLFFLQYYVVFLLVLGVVVTQKRYLVIAVKNLLFVWSQRIGIPTIVMAVFFSLNLSNSFILHEHHVLLFMLQIMVVCRFYPTVMQTIVVMQNYMNERTNKRSLFFSNKANKQYLTLILLFICKMMCFRLTILFHKCREENLNCDSSFFIVNLENLDSSVQSVRLAVSWVSVWMPILATVFVINYAMPKNFTVASVCLNYAIVFIGICICLQWWLSIAPPLVINKILGSHQMVASQCALAVSLVVFISIWLFPFLPERPWEYSPNLIFSSSVILFTFSFLLPLYVVVGDGMAPSLTVALIAAICYITLDRAFPEPTDLRMTLNVMVWSLSSHLWFYGTGHQPTFPSIQWHAAFAAHKETTSYVFSCLFVIMNTFSSHILHSLSLPMLLSWSQLQNDPKASLFRLTFMYTSFHGVKLLSAVIACFLLRRHLMVWAVFTPKLIFDSLGMLVTVVSVLMSYCFALRVTGCYHKLIKKNVGNIWSLKDQ